MIADKLCTACGTKISIDAKMCTNCGAAQKSEDDKLGTKEHKPKRTVATLLFWIFLGAFGGHRFYLGKSLTGAIMAIWATFGILGGIIYTGSPIGQNLFLSLIGLGIWMAIDFIRIITGLLKDKHGNELKG